MAKINILIIQCQVLAYAEGMTSGLRNYTSIIIVVVDINDSPPLFSVVGWYSQEQSWFKSSIG